MSRMKLAALLTIAATALVVGYASTGHAARTSVVVPKCPSHAPKFTATLGTSSPFVHPNAQFLNLCRYYKNTWGFGQVLWRHRVISNRATISSLTSAFNKLQEPPRGIFCVKDDGSEMLVIFGYGANLMTGYTPPERVVVKLSGCRFASNGKAVRSTTSQLHSRLLKLVSPKP
jgi:hypothetical protein